MQQSSIIEKSIALLDVLGEVTRPLTFTEIVNASDFNKSTVHRLLAILTSQGLINYNETSKTYMLGHKLLHLARKAWRGFDLQTLASDEMVRLNTISGENISIGMLAGNEVMHLRMIESQHHWGIVHPPVFNEPAHTTATGKAILAFLSPKIFDNWLDHCNFPRRTKRSITDRDSFLKEMKKIRKRGFATCDREDMDYIVGIAAPVFNFLNEPIASINIWAPTNRSSIKGLINWSDEIIASAKHISKLIGSNQY